MNEKFSSWQTHNSVLNGERIKQLHIDEDKLFITTDKAIHMFYVVGDCCSHSYFYEIDNVFQMLTWVVVDMESIDMPEVPTSEYGEYDEDLKAYAYKIHTEGGYGLIVFRNSSNGYYGGNMEYGGIVTADQITGKEITEDWNA
jgi:hypothetical protein